MKRFLLLAPIFVVFFIALNAKAGGLDENALVDLLPTVDDIPVPSWFTDKFFDIEGSHYSGYEEWSDTIYASFSGWKTTHDRVNSTTGSYPYYYYDQEIRIDVSIKVSDRTFFLSKYGRNVTETEFDFLFDKEWYSVGNGTTEFGYKPYEVDDNHFISYIDVKEAMVGESPHTYGVHCEAGYFFKAYGYGVYISLGADLYTEFELVDWDEEYLIPPENLMADDETCLRFLKDFFDSYTNKVFYQIEDVLAATKEPSDITILLEYYFDTANGKPLTSTWPDYVVNCGNKKYYLSCNMTVEHLATGKKEYIDVGFISGEISMDKVFNISLINSTGDGRFRITLDVFTSDSEYLDRVKDDSFLPNKAVIECNVEISSKGNIRKVTITKARNCWIKTGDKWEVLWSKNGYQQKDGTNGFAIKVRSVLAWEERIRYYIYKFLQESNFYSNVKNSNKFDLTKIENIPIYYLRTKTGYDPSLDVINMSSSPGNIYMYDSDEFDSLFHEFAHAIKEHAYHFADEDVDDYLGGAHGGTCDVSNIYFAFEEGHSEFFASLMVDYVKEEGLIEEQFLAPTDYYDSSCHFGKEGDKIEGAVAGLLLHGLYLNYTKGKYDNPQAKAYEIFAKACELCHKYLKHYPYSIHDIAPFIVAVEPRCTDALTYMDLVWRGGYNCDLVPTHIKEYPGKAEGLFGYPLLVAVEPSWFTSVEIEVNKSFNTIEEPSYGAASVADGMAYCAFIDKDTKIVADFGQGDGVYIAIFDMNGNPMEEILAMYKWIGKAEIEIEKDGIKVVRGTIVVKSNSGTTYKAGSKIKIVPHSEFVLSVENETAEIYVMDGKVSVDNGVSYKEINENKKATVTGESIDVSGYKDKEIEWLWGEFGDDMKALGIVKEEGKGGKQPGFEILLLVIAIMIIIAMKRKKIS